MGFPMKRNQPWYQKKPVRSSIQFLHFEVMLCILSTCDLSLKDEYNISQWSPYPDIRN